VQSSEDARSRSSAFRSSRIGKPLYIIALSHFRDASRDPFRWKMRSSETRKSGRRFSAAIELARIAVTDLPIPLETLEIDPVHDSDVDHAKPCDGAVAKHRQRRDRNGPMGSKVIVI